MGKVLALLLIILLALASGAGYLFLTEKITAGERQIADGQRQLEQGQSAPEEGRRVMSRRMQASSVSSSGTRTSAQPD